MVQVRPFLAVLGAVLLTASAVHAGGNPWRSSGDYYQGPGETGQAKPKSAPAFGKPGQDHLYPPLSENEPLAPPPPMQRDAPVYPPLEGGEAKPRPTPREAGSPVYPAPSAPAPAVGQGTAPANPPVVIIYPPAGYGYGVPGYGVPGYGGSGFGYPQGAVDPFSMGGFGPWGAPPAVGVPGLWGTTPGMW
jgi:hypothetical protein